MWKKVKVFVTVKAYPNLSEKYEETVCVAGITDEGNWIRMYPVPFRKLPPHKQFKRYIWIEVEAQKSKEHEKYQRKESHKIKPDTIEIVDESLSKSPIDWDARNKIILPLLNKSVEDLIERSEEDGTSLGLIKPNRIFDFYKKDRGACRDWEKELITGRQTTLCGDYKSPLEYIPYWMGYHFRCCDDRCKDHNMMCEDWELGELWRKMRDKYGLDNCFAKVKQKYFDELTKRDIYFYMGTESKWNNWLLIGVYYPPKKIKNINSSLSDFF